MDLSIITVTYNNIEGLKKTYHSIKEQVLKSSFDVEWIVVDGNSTDGTCKLLQSGELHFDNGISIQYKIESDNGIYDAMNKGIELSKGNHIIFLNGGDRLEGNEVIVNFCQPHREGNVVYYGNFIMNFREKLHINRKARDISYIKHSLPTSHQAFFYPIDFVRSYKYDLSYTISGDYYYTALAYKLGHNFKKLDFFVCSFESGGTSIKNIKILLKDMMRVQKEVLNLTSFFILLSAIKRFISLELTFILDILGKKLSRFK